MMSEKTYTDYSDQEIVLADEVRAVILLKHPEVEIVIDRLPDVLARPDEIRRSVTDDRAMLYYSLQKEVFGGKWIVVVVKRINVTSSPQFT